jgi:phage baseplate assembly protein W
MNVCMGILMNLSNIAKCIKAVINTYSGSRSKLLGKIDFGHTLNGCMDKLINVSNITRDIKAIINNYSARVRFNTVQITQITLKHCSKEIFLDNRCLACKIQY